jgi:hypothetical protein
MTQAPEQPRCPECGAPSVDGLDCWGQLGGIIAWESGNPELFAVHFHTVASYNLQHPAMFQDDALVGLRELFIEALDHDLPVHELRRRMSAKAEGAKRVIKGEAERKRVLHRWPMTIADVYLPEQPQGAAERVMAWAKSIRSEL